MDEHILNTAKQLLEDGVSIKTIAMTLNVNKVQLEKALKRHVEVKSEQTNDKLVTLLDARHGSITVEGLLSSKIKVNYKFAIKMLEIILSFISSIEDFETNEEASQHAHAELSFFTNAGFKPKEVSRQEIQQIAKSMAFHFQNELAKEDQESKSFAWEIYRFQQNLWNILATS